MGNERRFCNDQKKKHTQARNFIIKMVGTGAKNPGFEKFLGSSFSLFG